MVLVKIKVLTSNAHRRRRGSFSASTGHLGGVLPSMSSWSRNSGFNSAPSILALGGLGLRGAATVAGHFLVEVDPSFAWPDIGWASQT